MEAHQLGTLLYQLAHEFHHFKEESKIEGGPSSRHGRRHTRRLKNLEDIFDRMLERWVPDQALKAAWRGHFYHFEPVPGGVLLITPPLFRGRGPSGQTVEIRAVADGYEVTMDGKPILRLPDRPVLDGRRVQALQVNGIDVKEEFGAPPEAQEALSAYAAAPGEPPWEFAPELFCDGLIDVHFSLTERGRRLLDERRSGGPEGGVVVRL